MASCRVIYKASFQKDLRRLSKIVLARVSNVIDKLAEDPLPTHAAKLQIGGGLYRIRIGEYRLIYQVNIEAKEVVLHHVRHRREVYRGL